MKAYAAHLQFELRNGLRDRSLLLMNYLAPLFVYLIIGGIMSKLNPGFKEALIPSMVMFAILFSMVLSIPTPLVTARESGIFRSYRINGVPAINILTVPALTNFLHMIVVSLIIILTAGPHSVLCTYLLCLRWVWHTDRCYFKRFQTDHPVFAIDFSAFNHDRRDHDPIQYASRIPQQGGSSFAYLLCKGIIRHFIGGAYIGSHNMANPYPLNRRDPEFFNGLPVIPLGH